MNQPHGYSLRRNRINPILRDMLADTVVTPDNLMYPVFVRAGKGVNKPISSMPGVSQQSPDVLVKSLEKLVKLGLRAVIIFGIVDAKQKDARGSHIMGKDSVVAQALAAIKKAKLPLLCAVDVCFCEYTDHGHCGVRDHVTAVDNAATVENLGKQAVALAKAGADLIAPSGMMDGGVAGIRAALDDAGFSHLPIMAYTAKYASSFYGPFREAAESAPGEGNRKQYQQDYRRDAREALLEAESDIAEGADIVMVKPGLAYLDVLATLRNSFDTPLAAYHVSGEYAMWAAATEKGWIDGDGVLRETLIAFRRAGANIILTYAAPQALRLMQGGRL